MADPTKTPPAAHSTPPSAAPAPASTHPAQQHFLEDIVEADNSAKKWGTWPGTDIARVQTRFPPEPNGYLHIGHAKSICLNYGLAKKHGGGMGKFNLRFDDTNPAKEEREYVDAIKADVLWLGADFTGPHGGGVFWASDYFDRMYAFAEELIQKGKAYVCDLSAEEMAKRRGSPGVPATSPFRDRPKEESLRLIREMKEGKWPDGSKTVRAKIDLASPNFNLRDPVMYRILHEAHHNTGNTWCIYPMYDWAHGFEDSIEGVTHSICTLEFENHRPLYDWFIDAVNEGRGPGSPYGPKIHHSQQIEFSRLNLNYTVLSKRKLIDLVQGGHVKGWDDPRMPTIAGIRRRGYTPESIVAFCEDVSVTRQNSVIDMGRMENAIRNELNKRAARRMAVLRPLKVVIENFPEGKVEELEAVNNPEDPAAGKRLVPFTRELYIEREDFMENPPKKFFRLALGAEVRFRWAYFVKCVGVVKDAAGEVTELRCTYDPATRGGDAPDGRKVKGTIHWVSAAQAVKAEVRLFDRLFSTEEPGKATGNYLDDLNPKSLEVVTAYLEPSLATVKAGDTVQFERMGYFTVDRDSTPGHLVFNRTVTLKDTWAKIEQKER
jgi:glutaminyl-tRNA synthetase